MALDAGRVLGRDAKVRKDTRRGVNDMLLPVVTQKAAKVPDVFNELTLDFAGNYALIFRAYDDGVAYRFATSFPGEITVVSEQAEFAFADATTSSISPRKRASSPTRSGPSNISP